MRRTVAANCRDATVRYNKCNTTQQFVMRFEFRAASFSDTGLSDLWTAI